MSAEYLWYWQYLIIKVLLLSSWESSHTTGLENFLVSPEGVKSSVIVGSITRNVLSLIIQLQIYILLSCLNFAKCCNILRNHQIYLPVICLCTICPSAVPSCPSGYFTPSNKYIPMDETFIDYTCKYTNTANISDFVQQESLDAE